MPVQEAVHQVVVYRDPLDKAIWDALSSNPTALHLYLIFQVAVSAFVLYKFYKLWTKW